MTFESVAFRRISNEALEHFKKFDCGKPDLNSFLLEEALDYDTHGLTQTTLVFDSEDPCPIAYFSLSADAVKLTTFEMGELGLPFQTEIPFFPAVKITRFAVLNSRQRGGLGLHLINTIQGQVFTTDIAVRFLIVDALNTDDVLSFYRKAGFKNSMRTEKIRQKQKENNRKSEESETTHMIKDIYVE